MSRSSTVRVNQKSFKSSCRRLTIELAVVAALVGYSVHFPKRATYSQAWDFVFHHPFVLLHVIVGSIVLIEAIVLLIRTIQAKRLDRIMWSLLGFLSVLLAYAAGERYVATQELGYVGYMGDAWFAAILIYGMNWLAEYRRQKHETI